MTQTPILILTDGPSLPSGLARIGRDLATRIHSKLSDKFRVGYLGRGGLGGPSPFPVWTIPHGIYQKGDVAGDGAMVLPQVWDEFAKGELGILFTIWDPARMLWLACPDYITSDRGERAFLKSRPYKLWGYFPVDGHTPSGTLGAMAEETLKGYDRVLAYTRYGSNVIGKVLKSPVEWLPHGLSDIWFPRDKAKSRYLLGFTEDDFVVGVVATNQERKDWGLAAQIGARLKHEHGLKFHQWWHVDRMEGYWSINALLDEFQLGPHTLISLHQSDEWMAAAYSACDVTLAIGAGEGFGFPTVESQACGTPVIGIDYAATGELVPRANLVPMMDYRLEGSTNVMRPVSRAADWVVEKGMAVGDMGPLRWSNLWESWRQWLERGLQ